MNRTPNGQQPLHEFLQKHQATDRIPGAVVTQAEELLTQHYHRPHLEEIPTSEACVSALLIAAHICHSKGEATFSLNQILESLHTSLSENLKSLDMLAQSLSLDEDISRAILLLCRDCIYFLMLREKFETLSAKFTESASNLGEEAILMEYAQFGWLFITHCKNYYFSQVSGSGDRAVTLFVAAFAFYITIHPHRVPSENEMSVHEKEEDQLRENYQRIVKMLSEEESVKLSDALEYSEKIWEHVYAMNILYPSHRPEAWLSEHRPANIKALDEDYEKYNTPFHMDYRQVARERGSTKFTARSPVKPANLPVAPFHSPAKRTRSAELITSPRLTASRPSSSQPTTNTTITPQQEESMREALVTWIEELFPDEDSPAPSANLQRFFQLCDQDPTESIQHRFEKVSESVLPVLCQQKMRAMYYRLLDTMLTEEETRLKKSNFSTLLHHDVFHCSLVRCCVEIVAFVYKKKAALFPEDVGISSPAFELSKIIDNVIRYEKDMPPLLRQHLKSVDHRILESHLWKSGSPVFQLLQAGGNAQQKYLEKTLLNRISSPNPRSPAPSARQEARSQLYSPVKPPGQPVKSLSLEIIFRKVVDLMLLRTQKLVRDLQIGPTLEYVVISLVHQITSRSQLLEDRHLDQLMICTVYGVARVMKLETITFRRIIQCYRVQPQAHSSIWKKVIRGQGGNHCDIIEYYNSIFITAMERYLLRFQADPAQLSVSPGNNIPVNSPVKITTMASPVGRSGNTPQKALSYNVGQSPSKDLRRYNQEASRDHTVPKKARKRLFPANTQEETPPAAKRSKSTPRNEPEGSTPANQASPHLAEAITSLTQEALSAKQPSILRSSK